MKVFLALLLTTLTLCAQSTVNFSAGPGQRDVRDVTGAPVLTGLVTITTPSGLEYGRTDIREIFGEPARFAGTASSWDPAFDDLPIWLNIYSPQGMGTFTAESWRFPIQGSIPPDNTISIYSSDVDTAIVGFFNQGHLILHIPESTDWIVWIFFGLFAMMFWPIRNEN